MQPGPSLIPDSVPRFPLHLDSFFPPPPSSQLCSTCLTNHCCRTSDRRLHTQPRRCRQTARGGRALCFGSFLCKSIPSLGCPPLRSPSPLLPPTPPSSLKLTALLGGVGMTSQQTLPFPACGSMEGSLQHTAASPSLVKNSFCAFCPKAALVPPSNQRYTGQGRQGNAQENDAQQNAL